MTTKDEIEAIRARWSKVALHVTPADDPTIVGAKEDVMRLLAIVDDGADGEPRVHSHLSDHLPKSHPLAWTQVHCKLCNDLVHAANNECMQTWIEFSDGALCAACVGPLPDVMHSAEAPLLAPRPADVVDAAVAEERAACEAVCRAEAADPRTAGDGDDFGRFWQLAAKRCADAIAARGRP